MKNDNPHLYTTKQGVVLELRPVSSLLIRQLQNDRWGMPQPPVVETEIGPKGSKHKSKQTNLDDPDYKAALVAWEEARQEKFIAYLLARAVCDEPSADDQERLREFIPGASPTMLKYTWVLEHLADDDELGDIAQAIMGQTVPTAGGISQAEGRFPGDGERDANPELPATENTGDGNDRA